MLRGRRNWFSMLTDLAIRVHVERPIRSEIARQMRRLSFGIDVSRWPLRMNAFLRDRLRRRWLRIKKNDD